MSDEDLRLSAKRLVRLLDDPHPGLYTWNEAVHAEWKHIADGFVGGIAVKELHPGDAVQTCLGMRHVTE